MASGGRARPGVLTRSSFFFPSPAAATSDYDTTQRFRLNFLLERSLPSSSVSSFAFLFRSRARSFVSAPCFACVDRIGRGGCALVEGDDGLGQKMSRAKKKATVKDASCASPTYRIHRASSPLSAPPIPLPMLSRDCEGPLSRESERKGERSRRSESIAGKTLFALPLAEVSLNFPSFLLSRVARPSRSLSFPDHR